LNLYIIYFKISCRRIVYSFQFIGDPPKYFGDHQKGRDTQFEYKGSLWDLNKGVPIDTKWC